MDQLNADLTSIRNNAEEIAKMYGETAKVLSVNIPVYAGLPDRPSVGTYVGLCLHKGRQVCADAQFSRFSIRLSIYVSTRYTCTP